MQSLLIVCACFWLNNVGGSSASTYTSIAASNDLVVACEGTDLRVPDVVHVIKSGKEIGTIDMPADLDSDDFKQSVCDRIEGGLIIDTKANAIYVAMDDMYGKSSFGASLIKIDIATLKIAIRLKMPSFDGPASAVKGTTAGAMTMTPNDKILVSDRQGRFHVVDLKTFSFNRTVSLPEKMCEDSKPEATSIALDSEAHLAFLNVCGNIHCMSLQSMEVISSLRGKFIEGKLIYANTYLLAYANVPGPGVYDHGTPKFMKIAVSMSGNMTVQDELSLAVAKTHQFFGDGGEGAYFLANKLAVFTGAGKAPCPDIPGQGCPHEITKLASIVFQEDGQMQLRKVMDFSPNFTAITCIARKSNTSLIIAGYSGIPIKAGILEVSINDFSVAMGAVVDNANVV